MTAQVFPQALDMERALLGGLMLCPGPDAYDAVREAVQPTDFYRPDHTALFVLIMSLIAEGVAPDLISVTTRIRTDDEQGFGGYSYIIRMVEDCPATANLTYYASVVAEKARLRRLIAKLDEARAAAFEQAQTADQIAVQLTSAVDEVGTGAGSESDWDGWGELVDRNVRHIEAALDGRPVPGWQIPSLPELGSLVPRLRPGDLIIVAGRPAMGKTSLAIGLAKDVASQGATVGVFALEMPGERLALGDLARIARRQESQRLIIPIDRVQGLTARDLSEGRVSDPASWDSIVEAQGIARELPILVARSASVTLEAIVIRTRRLARKLAAKGQILGSIVIDYLGLIERKHRGGQSDASALGEISRALKLLAMEIGAPIILLCQLNRECEKREDKRPRMADLRDSGAIEQDADTILFVYRDVVYDPDTVDRAAAEIIVAKNRGGEIGTADVRWCGPSTEFYSAKLNDIIAGI
jgi:replicative DNA helicase